MAMNDSDLFDRLRQAGLRMQVAKTLSEISVSASKKSLRAARSAVGELRSLAEEIERRLPSVTAARSATSKPVGRGSTRSPAAAPRGSRSRGAGATAGRGAKRPVTERKSAVAPPHKAAAAAGTGGARAPRGQNKAKILESLTAAPKTAAEIAMETGIGTGTVRSTLSKLATAGEVAKAGRGYRLPQELELEPQERTDDAREHPADTAERADGAEREHEQAQADALEAQRGTEDAEDAEDADDAEDVEDAREHPADAAERADGAEREHEQAQADALEAPEHAETSGQPSPR